MTLSLAAEPTQIDKNNVFALYQKLKHHLSYIVFGGNLEAVFIQHTANDEAQRAISTTEAILIRVFWHREASSNTQEKRPSQSWNPGQQHPTAHKVFFFCETQLKTSRDQEAWTDVGLQNTTLSSLVPPFRINEDVSRPRPSLSSSIISALVRSPLYHQVWP